MSSEQEPTWSDIGVVAEAVSVLTNRADLSHDLLVELAGPLLRRLAIMGDRIMLDPHGDSDAAREPDPENDDGPPVTDGEVKYQF